MKKKKLLIAIVLVLSILIHTSVVFIPTTMIDGYFMMIRPMFWIILFYLVLVFFDKNDKLYKDKGIIVVISILGITIYLFMLFISGIFMKFSHNPMDSSFLGIIRNFWTYIPVIFIKEYIRSRIMQTVNKKNQYKFLFIVTLIFTYLSIENLRSVLNLSMALKFDFALTNLLPVLFLNLFLTYAALKGSMLGNMVFQFLYSGLFIFIPILPNTPKIYEAIILYLTIFIMYIVYDKTSWDKEQKQNGMVIEKYRWKWLIFPGTVLAICLLFGIGVFPYVPVAVASNSMKNEFGKGDVVLVKKVSKIAVDEIKEGQVIQFRTATMDIVHRVIEKTVTPQGEIQFVTKGDNNERADASLVKETQVVGVVEYKIPLIGWPSLFFSSLR